MTRNLPRAPDTEIGRDPRAAHHDLGGHPRFLCAAVLPADEAPGDASLSAFDKRVDALRQLLSAKGLLRVDELRRGIEAIPEHEYHALSYYERWLRSITGLLLEKGMVVRTELADGVAAIEWVRR